MVATAMVRRVAAVAAMAAAALGWMSLATQAQQPWPTKPVRLIVPYAPGGGTDTIARPWADKLSQAFGQQFVIDNKGGAGGSIGTEAAAKAAPDGYTFLLAPNGPLLVLPHLRKMPYDPFKDFVPVGRTGDLVAGFVLHPSIPATNIKELVDYAKANPGKLNFGSAGLGTGTHLRIEMLKLRAGVNIVHVPYRGSAEALNDLLGGHVQMMNEIVSLPHAKAGKLRLLAISYPSRHPDFPDVPTLAEQGYPNSDVPIWYAIWAPQGTPQAIVDRLNAEMVTITRSPEMQQRMREISVVIPPQTPAEITATMQADNALYADLIKRAGVTLE